MKPLGAIEACLYKKLNSKDTSVLSCKEIVDNLDYLSYYFQASDPRKLPVSIIDKVNNIISKFIKIEDDNKGLLMEPCGDYGNLFSEFTNSIFLAHEKVKFTFIDLFAGIGGFRLACQNNGGKCVFSSEWDLDAKKTYFHNFGEYPFGDITSQKVKDCIPEKFDLLCAGFPCQAFSIAGYRRGFEDTRGTLFFDVASILRTHRPKGFILENVKNLVSHDNGKTFEVIYNTLKELGYEVFSKVFNTMDYANIPQNRERIIIVGLDPNQVSNYAKFAFPSKRKLTKSISDCIDYSEKEESLFYRESSPYFSQLKENMTNKETIYQWRRQYVRENKSNVCPTLTANMGTGGHNVPLIITDFGYRKLTPKECLNFQGFPEKYEFPPIAKSKQYKQAGNSVTVPLIERIVKNIIEVL